MSYQNTVDIFLRFFFKEIDMSGKTCYKRVWHRRPPFFINGPIEDTSTPDEENPDDWVAFRDPLAFWQALRKGKYNVYHASER
jgi:hypothetical protein